MFSLCHCKRSASEIRIKIFGLKWSGRGFLTQMLKYFTLTLFATSSISPPEYLIHKISLPLLSGNTLNMQLSLLQVVKEIETRCNFIFKPNAYKFSIFLATIEPQPTNINKAIGNFGESIFV